MKPLYHYLIVIVLDNADTVREFVSSYCCRNGDVLRAYLDQSPWSNVKNISIDIVSDRMVEFLAEKGVLAIHIKED